MTDALGHEHLRAVPAAAADYVGPEETGGDTDARLVSLVELARGRDADAFAALYNLRFYDVSRYVGAIVRDDHQAEDVVAQTFLRAWKSLPTLREAERFDAWLFRIAHHEAMSDLRKRRPVPLADHVEPVDSSRFSSPSEMAHRREQAEVLGAALLALPEDQRMVLILRFLRERSHREVAEAMGRSEAAVRQLQRRALARMRRVLPADEHAA